MSEAEEAARYRWLREQHNSRSSFVCVMYDDTTLEDFAGIPEPTLDLDAAIAIAMTKETT